MNSETLTSAYYAVDNSGSTGGTVLSMEIQSVESLMEFIKCDRLIAWNSIAIRVSDTQQLRRLGSTGGTRPQTIADHINDAKMLIIHTDGEISESDMKVFETSMANHIADIPLLVVLTVGSSFTASSTVKSMERSVNMSIPNVCLALSNHVAVVVNVDGYHRTITSKGCFDIYNFTAIEDSTKIIDLPVFDFQMLKTVEVMRLAPGYIKLSGISDPVCLENIYSSTQFDEAFANILEALMQRAHLPRLDAARMRTLLQYIKVTMSVDQELNRIREMLAEMSVSDRAGSQEHRDLAELYRSTRRGTGDSATKTRILRIVNQFHCALNEYQSSGTSFVFGSNRAMNANFIENSDDVGDCLQVEECPIMLSPGSACILLQEPECEGEFDTKEMIKRCTDDYSIEAPFQFGAWLTQFVSPGVYSHEFASNIMSHPSTRRPILGFVPLSRDPKIIMNHMCKIFCGSKVLWHMVRAYISMIAHAQKYEWFPRDLTQQQIQALSSSYMVSQDIKASEVKVSLMEVIKYTFGNYTVHLRDRSPSDIRALIVIAKVIDPNMSFPEDKIRTMASTMEVFSQMLTAFKRDDHQTKDLYSHLMEMDEYEHHIQPRRDLRACIAHIFYHDTAYRQMRFQEAINTACQDSKFGNMFKNYIIGIEPSTAELGMFDFAYEEPDPSNVHFQEERYGSWGRYGLPSTPCCFCGHESSELMIHLRSAFGRHFFNGHLTIINTMSDPEWSNKSDREIFIQVKKSLYHKYGFFAGFLHTQHCRTRLLTMIKNLRAARSS